MKQNQNTLHSEKVLLDGKSFFLDLKKAKNGTSYLVITQAKPMEDQKYERIKMILFEEEINQFNNAFAGIVNNFTPSQKPSNREAYIAKIRETHPMAFYPWSKEDEEVLIALFNEGKSIPEIAKGLQRQDGAIKARLEKVGLIETANAA